MGSRRHFLQAFGSAGILAGLVGGGLLRPGQALAVDFNRAAFDARSPADALRLIGAAGAEASRAEDLPRGIGLVDGHYQLSDVQATQILEMAPTKMKIGSPDDVEKILNSALPGVHLVHAQQTPAALPVRVGNHYFILEPQGQIFDRMRKARSICIYVPQALLNLKLELFAVFH